MFGRDYSRCKDVRCHPRRFLAQVGAGELGEILSGIENDVSGDKQKAAYISGDVGDAVMTIGQVAGLIHEIPSVREIIEGMIAEAKLISQRLHNIGISA